MIVPTIGRETLARTVASIEPQLGPGDELIVIEAPYTGDFGNRSRDQGCLQATGTMLMFCDDDDVFTPDALETVRAGVGRQTDRVHLFRMDCPDGRLWTEAEVRMGDVGTPMFVIPNVKALVPSWQNPDGPFSDFRFLTDTLALHGTGPVFHEEVIAVIG